MDKTLKRMLICIAFGVGLFVLLNNAWSIFGIVKTMFGLMIPVVLGFIMAFVLNVPMKGFRYLYELAFKKAKRRPPDKAVDIVCVLLVFALVAFLFWAIVMLAIPSLTKTVSDVIDIIKEQIPKLTELLKENDIDPTILERVIDFLHLDEDYNVGVNFSKIINQAFSTVKSMFTALINIIFALVVCVYALLSKAELHIQVKRLGYSIFPHRVARYLGHVYVLIRDTYTKFLSAQCIEAVILGVLMYVAFLAFGIPYAALVAVLTALFAFLPYIGAFGACFIGAFLTLVSAPDKVLLCVIVYTVVQFTENQFIYPHVVGNSVGLTPVWTLIAALVGGSLLGLFGMIFFIPLASVIYTLLGEFTAWRLAKKKIDATTGEYIYEDGAQVEFEFDVAPKKAESTEDDANADEGEGCADSAVCAEHVEIAADAAADTVADNAAAE